MNITKHMEAIAIVAIVLLCTATAVASNHTHAARGFDHAASAAKVAPLAADGAMQTITVTARRLTAAEKAVLPL